MQTQLPLASDVPITMQMRELAQTLGIEQIEQGEVAGAHLRFTVDGLALVPADIKQGKPLRIDFTAGKSEHRRRFGGGRGQPLARAIGLQKGRTPSVVDATAGLGRDGFVLATLGCRVVLLERSVVIWALLRDALDRAQASDHIPEIMDRIRLFHAESASWLAAPSEEERGEVVYLDPMYPHRKKSALVKKEMRLFRALVGDDLDAGRLLEAARAHAIHRVVVKRPAGAGWLADQRPDHHIKSPNTRYDVYVNRGFGS